MSLVVITLHKKNKNKTETSLRQNKKPSQLPVSDKRTRTTTTTSESTNMVSSTTTTTTLGSRVALTLFMVLAILSSWTSQNTNNNINGVEALAGVFRRVLSRGGGGAPRARVTAKAAGTRSHKARAAFVSVKAVSSSSSAAAAASVAKEDDAATITTKSVLPTVSQTTASSATQSTVAFFDADMYRQEMTDLVYQRQMNRLNLS